MGRPFKKLKPVEEPATRSRKKRAKAPATRSRKKRDKEHNATPTVLNKTAAARRWGCSVDTIERGIARGQIRTVRIHKRELVLVSSVEGPVI
jgi:hypothetical protein